MFAAAAAANSAAFNICGYQRTRRSISMRRVTATRRSLAVNNNNKNNNNNIESVSHESEQQQDEEEDHVKNSLGVEAAITMLRFYKKFCKQGRYRRCYQRVVDMYPPAVNIPWKLIRNTASSKAPS
ncbi:hypothetical protein OIU77_004758 [Salix suchowensis]|uniref:Uncharacterized protein n=1 Tax=Salix suchowensis TaxID=1278906 RepID=A0ABQ9AVJ8_9ROSI|nr:hypothetical protein OIU77_004758 [Salix suchowensis]